MMRSRLQGYDVKLRPDCMMRDQRFKLTPVQNFGEVVVKSLVVILANLNLSHLHSQPHP